MFNLSSVSLARKVERGRSRGWTKFYILIFHMVVAESILYLLWNLYCSMAINEMTTVQSSLKESHRIFTQTGYFESASGYIVKVKTWRRMD